MISGVTEQDESIRIVCKHEYFHDLKKKKINKKNILGRHLPESHGSASALDNDQNIII